jgi:hypothetical protein
VPGDIFRPDNDILRKDVRNQLQQVLSSSVFQDSKRYAAVLKYIVDRTLDGAGDQLKERTIGIEVFSRAPDYDTASDHAVRSAVAEVRKRLAQYYQENPRDALRIEVLPGSYMPQFRWAESAALAPRAAQPVQVVAAPALPAAATPARASFLKRNWIAVVSLLLLASVATAISR